MEKQNLRETAYVKKENQTHFLCKERKCLTDYIIGECFPTYGGLSQLRVQPGFVSCNWAVCTFRKCNLS